MSHRPRFSVLAAVGIFAVVACGGAAAHATPPENELSSVVVGGTSGTKAANLPAEDIALLATDLGITEAEAAERFRGQNDFLAALAIAIESFPDRYSSSAWGKTPTADAWVAFTGEKDEKLIELFSSLPVLVDVRFGAVMTEAEAENTQREVMTQIAASESVSQIEGLPDPVAGTFKIRYEQGASRLRSNELNASIEQVKSAHDGLRFDIAVADEAIDVDPEQLRGGVGVNGCTAAFTIRILGTTQYNGLLSAAHCPDAAGVPQDSTYSTVHRGQHAGSYGEVQKHSSSDPTPTNRVVVGRTSTSVTTRTVSSVIYPTVGQSVCNYGKTRTTASCTTVRAVGVAFNANIDGTTTYVGRMVQSNGTFTNPGDSGGPWYNGTSAVGVHFGKYDGYSTFSQVGFAQSILGVAVRTN